MALFLNIPKKRPKPSDKRKKGDFVDEDGTTPTKSDNIAKDNKDYLKRADRLLDPVAVDKAARSRAISLRNRNRSSRIRAEKTQELREMQAAGFFPIDDVAKSLDVEERRREVFKLHLRGYDQTHMSEIFGVHRQTIVKDMNVVRNKLVQELTTLGAEGLVTQSYTMYELLQHEVLKRVDLLPVDAIKQVTPLIRLAKDLEDSKVKLLSTIGALKPRAIQGAERIAKGDKTTTPEVRAQDMTTVLERISARYQSEIIEGEIQNGDDDNED